MKVNIILGARRSNLVTTPILILAALSVLLNISAEESHATLFFEIIVLLFCAVPNPRLPSKQLLIIIATSIYITCSFLYAYFLNNTGFLDFALAYKAFYYLILLSFCSSNAHFPLKRLDILLKLLIVFFVIKYSISRLILGISRPILFTENNYELIFVIIIYYINFTLLKKLQTSWLLLLILVFLLSGSRSSIAALAFTIPFMTMRRIDQKTVIGIILLSISTLSLYYIFSDRLAGNSIDSIDRVKFLNLFLYEVRDWNLLNFLLGSERLTPLSNYTCQSLSYYQTLMSYKGDGSCYSVALHSYILRAIFDHGLIVLSALTLSIVFLLSRAGYSRAQILCILGIITITSFSVSSLNNAYVALALAITIAAGRTRLLANMDSRIQPHEYNYQLKIPS